MVLARNPERITDQQEIIRLGGSRLSPGITTPATGFRVGKFCLRCQKASGCEGWIPRIVLQEESDEGYNRSVNLVKGVYPTGQMYDSDAGGRTDWVRGGRNREIYMIIDQEVSQQSYRSEQEHCDDIRHACELTLKTMDRVVRDAMGRLAAEVRRLKSFQTKREAIRKAKGLLIECCPHDVLKRIVGETILADGTVTGTYEQKMADLYRNTAKKSQLRDSEGWHTFDVSDTEYRPWFSSCRGYDMGNHDYRKIALPLKIRRKETPPSTESLITLD